MRLKVGLAKTFWLVVPILLAISGLGVAAASYIRYATLKPRVDALAADRSADAFTPAFHAGIAHRARWAGLVLLALGVAIGLSRRQLERQTSTAYRAVKAYVKETWAAGSAALAGDSRGHVAALAAILVVAVCLRVAFLFQPMRYDEAFTFTNYASKPLYIGLSSYTYPNNHVFHTLLVHMAYRLFGSEPWALRLPALVAGALMVPAAYGLIRVLYDKHTALLAAGLLAVSSPLVVYSTHARGYSLIGLVFVLLLMLAVDLKQSRPLGAWVLFGLFSIVGFWTVPVMLYPLGTVVAWLVLSALVGDASSGGKRLVLDLAVTCGLIAAGTLALYSPALVVSGPDAFVANRFVAPIPWASFVANARPSLDRLWEQWNHNLPAWLSYTIAGGFLVCAVFHRRLSAHGVPVPAAALIACVPLVVAQRVVPFERVWLFLLPLYVGGACAGLCYLASQLPTRARAAQAGAALAAVAATLFLGLHLFWLRSADDSQDNATLRSADAIAAWLKPRLGPDDRVMAACPADAPLAYYFGRHGLPPSHFYGPLKPTQRIIVVVNDTEGQTFEGVLKESGLARSDVSAPATLGRFEDATLYETRYRR